MCPNMSHTVNSHLLVVICFIFSLCSPNILKQNNKYCDAKKIIWQSFTENQMSKVVPLFPRSCSPSSSPPLPPPSNLPNAVFTCVCVLLPFRSTFSRRTGPPLQATLSQERLSLRQALAEGWMSRDSRKPLRRLLVEGDVERRSTCRHVLVSITYLHALVLSLQDTLQDFNCL